MFKKEIDYIVRMRSRPDRVLTGGCRLEADAMVERRAHTKGIPLNVFQADWIPFGEAAGTTRNIELMHHATHVLAFPSRLGENTQHALSVAGANKVHVVRID